MPLMSYARHILLLHSPDQDSLSWQTFGRRVVTKAAFATILVAMVGLANSLQTQQTPANANALPNQQFIVELQVSGQ